jgi:heptosyltransferase-3
LPTQTDTLDRLPSGSRVVVIRLRSLGDCVLSTPAITLLKEARSDLAIAVVAEDRFAGVFDGNPAIDQVLPPSLSAVRSFDPDLLLNLHGGTRSARLTALSGAPRRAGFDIFRPGWIYNIHIPTAQRVLGVDRRVHTAEHAAAAVFYLGVPVQDVPRAQVPALPGRSPYAPSRPYAVIHPFAATKEKTWPAAKFLELALYLDRQCHLQPVFTGGPGDDLAAFPEWPTVSAVPIQEFARLVRGATFFAGNDSGPAHVAAAFAVPQLIFFGPSDSAVWSPWRTQAEVLQADGPIANIPMERALAALENLHIRAGVATT